jgi:hypothetical protein
VCSADPWNGGNFCKTDLGNANCITQGVCGESQPPNPKPKKPILALQENWYSLDASFARPVFGVVSTNSGKEIAASVADLSGIPEEGVHLRATVYSVGYGFPGSPDEAVGLGSTGHVFSAKANDGVAHLRSCYYTSPSGQMITSGEADLAPGQALIVQEELAGQQMIVAIRFTNYDEDEFAQVGEAVQKQLQDEFRSSGNYPQFKLMMKNAPSVS